MTKAKIAMIMSSGTPNSADHEPRFMITRILAGLTPAYKNDLNTRRSHNRTFRRISDTTWGHNELTGEFSEKTRKTHR
jgi:hypothetical protein